MNNNENENNASENLEEEEEQEEEEEEEEYEESEEEQQQQGYYKTEQTLEYQQSLLTAEIFEHPIFSFKDRDELLGPLNEYIKSLLVPFPDKSEFKEKIDQFSEILFSSIFGKKSTSELKEEFSKLGLESKTICGGFLSSDMICFRCLDCEIASNVSSTTSLICVECFDKSSHEGHRVVVLKSDGFCDCGDSELVKPEGFCPDHKRVELNREVELRKFPATLAKSCKEGLQKAFYGWMAIFDIVERLKRGNSYEALELFGQKFFDRVLLELIESAYTEMSNSFVLLVNSVFESRLEAPFNKTWHDCDCLKHQREYKTTPVHDCKCSILSMVFRYSVYTSKEDDSNLKKVLTECLKEVQFRSFAGPEMAKNVQLLVPLAYLPDHEYIQGNSSLTSVHFILCNNSELTIKMLRSGYFQNYIELIKETVNNYEKISNKIMETAPQLLDLAMYLVCVDYKDSMKVLISETNVVCDILDILLTLQTKFFYQNGISIKLHDHEIDYELIRQTLCFQKDISAWIENILKYVSRCDSAEKDAFFNRFVKEWYSRYQVVMKNQNKSQLSVIPVYERLLGYMLRSFEYELSQEGILIFFAKYLPGIKLEELAENVMANILKCFGFMRFIGGVLDTDLERLLEGYYLFWGNFSEIDVLTVQKMIIIASPKTLLEVIGDNFFWYDQEMRTQWREPSSLILAKDERLKRKLIVLKDFLMFLVYLMNDELCLLNVKSETAFAEKFDEDPNYIRVVQKATANIMFHEYWTEYGFIKENLSNSILYNTSKISQVLPNISVYNDKDQKIRIKDELEADLDPYIFYKTPLLQADIIIKAASRIEKNRDIDVIAGKSYNDSPGYLLTIKEKLFQSPMMVKYLNKLIQSSNKDIRPSLIPVTLKLILFNSQLKDNVEGSSSALVKNNVLKLIKENYLNRGFLDSLNDLSKKEDLKECKSCILKIQNLLKGEGVVAIVPIDESPVTPSTTIEIQKESKTCVQKISSIFCGGKPAKRRTQSVAVTPLEISREEDEVEKKKKAAQEKMNKMKAEFAKKQALFANKNKDAFEKEGGSEVADKTCPYCLVKIDESKDSYGVPVFLTHTNNYVTPPYTSDSWLMEQSFASWMPVMSSCYHYYHKKCFGEAFKNSRASEEAEVFKNSVECYCSLCKTLCNYFHIMNEGPAEPENPANPVPEILSIGIFKTLMNLMMVQRLRIRLDHIVSFSWNFETIPKRMIKYFIETYYLNQKPDEFEKAYDLHVSFFKSLKNVSQSSFNVNAYNDSFLAIYEQEKKIHIDDIPPADGLERQSIYYLRISPEQITNEKLARFTLSCLLFDGNEEKQQELIDLQVKTLCEYIQIKIYSDFILEKRGEGKDYREYYKNNLTTLEDFVFNTLASPIRRFALFIHFNKCLLGLGTDKNKKICQHVLNSITKDDIDGLFDLVAIPFTVESLLNKFVLEIENDEQQQVKEYVEMTRKTIPEEVLKVKPESFVSKFVDLPETYAEFNNTFYRKKCKVCKKYSEQKRMSLCLICGDVMCESHCEWNGYANPLGNYNTHACAFHIGTAVFYSLFNSRLSVVVSPFNVVTVSKSLYSDRFGRSINQALEEKEDSRDWLKLDFKQFVLNSKFVKELKHMITHQEIEKEFFKKLVNLNNNQRIPQNGSL